MAKLKILLNGIELHSIDLDTNTHYIAGRDETCQIHLQDQAISRRHFKISYNGGVWVVERLSKFGKILKGQETVQKLELRSQDTFHAPPYGFLLIEESAVKGQSANTGLSTKGSEKNPENNSTTPGSAEGIFDPDAFSKSLSQPSSNEAQNSYPDSVPSTEEPPGGNHLAPFHQTSADNPDVQNIPVVSGTGENTHVGLVTFVGSSNELAANQNNVLPYLVVRTPNGDETTLRLEGDKWVLGRDADLTEVMIDDRKCSRKHMEIRLEGAQYVVTDLDSTQGTYLNGKKLSPHNPEPLYSQDILRAGDSELIFEIRNPQFEKQLNELPDELQNPLENAMVSTSADANPNSTMPYFSGSDVPLLPPPDFSGKGKKRRRPKKKKGISPLFKAMVIAFVAVAIYIGLEPGEKKVGGSGSTTSGSNDPKGTDPGGTPTSRLSKDQQEFVARSFDLATNYVKVRNYEAAIRELDRIHELLPTGYERSKQMETYVQNAIDADKKRREVEEFRKKEEAARKKVLFVLSDCNQRLKGFKVLTDLQNCLAPAIEIDPGNSTAQAMVDRLKRSIEEAIKNKEVANSQANRIKAGEDAFKKAQQAATANPLRGIAAYQEFVKSSHPDPKGHKETAKKEITRLQGEISSKAEIYFKEAQDLQASAKLREAALKFDKVIEIMPSHMQAKEIRTKISQELYKKMKTIYGDSVLEESLGRVEDAKEKWHQIMATDLPDGEYFQKAKIKLSRYGEK